MKNILEVKDDPVQRFIGQITKHFKKLNRLWKKAFTYHFENKCEDIKITVLLPLRISLQCNNLQKIYV